MFIICNIKINIDRLFHVLLCSFLLTTSVAVIKISL